MHFWHDFAADCRAAVDMDRKVAAPAADPAAYYASSVN